MRTNPDLCWYGIEWNAVDCGVVWWGGVGWSGLWCLIRMYVCMMAFGWIRPLLNPSTVISAVHVNWNAPDQGSVVLPDHQTRCNFPDAILYVALGVLERGETRKQTDRSVSTALHQRPFEMSNRPAPGAERSNRTVFRTSSTLSKVRHVYRLNGFGPTSTFCNKHSDALRRRGIRLKLCSLSADCS